MKIRLAQRKNTVNMRITAQSTREVADLNDLVIALGTQPDTGGAIKIAEFLAGRGYRGKRTKQTAKTLEFTVSAGCAGSEAL